jgi:type II secretory pathway component GspD/PulD (secretin)
LTALTAGDSDEASQPQDDRTAVPDTDPRADEPAGDSKPGAEVTITLQGGDLVITSSDLEALDDLQDLIETLARAIPVQTQWTVFYLRSADATEAAAMLEQLFPSSSVSLMAGSSDNSLMGGLTSGIASLGRGLADMTGLSDLGSGPQTLRIIPDLRSNSLFVMGPADMVQDVEEVLKILDSSELPGTLRDRVPRMITVDSADVDEVAAIVRDVYRDYLESPQQRAGGDRNNPLAMLMGMQGGGGDQRRGGGRTPEVRMTLGVDRRTNQLIVSAEDSLFRQVEALVQSLDAAAQAAQQTVRVVKLEHTQANVVQEALQSMIPKVSVSVTRSGTSEGRGPAAQPAPQQPQPQSQPGEDEIRRMFEQRIREQFLRGAFPGGGGGENRGFPGAGGSGGPGGRTDPRSSGGSSGRRGSDRD